MLKSIIVSVILCVIASAVSAAEHYALLVGVREYDPSQLTSLRFTENDANQLAAVLGHSGYSEENLVLMTQTRGAESLQLLPTSKQIRRQLNLLTSEVSEDDTLLIAFSGHGVQFKDEDNIYFCPMDADLSDRSSLISLTDVYQLLGDRNKCKARTKVLLVDACRNDPQSRLSRSKGIELEPAGINRQADPPGGVAAFFSCSRGQQSFEHPERENGIFAGFVIDALSGAGDLDQDGEVSLAELEQFTVKQTQRFARTRLGESQIPERRGTIRGETTLAIVNRTWYIYDPNAAITERTYDTSYGEPELRLVNGGALVVVTKVNLEERQRNVDGKPVTYTISIPYQEELQLNFKPRITNSPPAGYRAKSF